MNQEPKGKQEFRLLQQGQLQKKLNDFLEAKVSGNWKEPQNLSLWTFEGMKKKIYLFHHWGLALTHRVFVISKEIVFHSNVQIVANFENKEIWGMF